MKAVLALVSCLATHATWAASGCDGAGSCYVRSGATGTDSGADWTNAYADLPPTLTRGVTYWVAAGTYPPHTFADPDSGTTLITVKAPTSTDHGTSVGWKPSYVGQALWQCTGPCGAIWDLQRENYIVLDGSYSTPLAPYSEIATSGYGFKLKTNGYGGNGNTGNGCVLCGIVLGGGGPFNYPGAGTFDHDITMRYVEVEGNHQSADDGFADAAFQFEGGSYNLLFSHLYVHHATWDFVLRGDHDGQAGFGPGNDITIEYCHMDYDYTAQSSVDGPHGTPCSCSEGLKNFTWRYNAIANMVGTSAGPDTASGAGHDSGNGPGGPWYVYGNIWYADDAAHCAVGDGMLAIYDYSMADGDLWFVNNSIINEGYPFCPTDWASYGIGMGSETPMHGFYDQNNLWYHSDISVYNGSDLINSGTMKSGGTQGGGAYFSTPVVHSHHAFFDSPKTAESDTSSSKQVSSGIPFIALPTNDFRLVADTLPGAALANTGTYWNGSAEVPNTFDVDMNGKVRSTWSRGALQFGDATVSRPAAPTGLTARVAKVP